MERKYFKEAAVELEKDEYTFELQRHKANSVSCYAHIHNAIELLYVIKGEYTVLLDNNEFEIEQGDMVLFCSNAIHHVVAHNTAENQYYVIKISMNVLVNLIKPMLNADFMMRFVINRNGVKYLWKKKELENSEILYVIKELVREYDAQNYAVDIVMKVKIVELLVAIMRENEPENHSVQPTGQIYDVITYIREHYAEDIDEKEIAKEIGLSYSYFSRSFKNVTGMTFRQCLNLIRINQAERMIYRDKKTVSEIASLCGYNSVSYFISVYRLMKGKTPYQVLKENKTDNRRTEKIK